MPAKVVNKAKVFLKNGTEAEWVQLVDFVPGQGEPIVYLADATHAYPRLKIGDGITPLKDIPFVGLDSIPGFDPNNIVAKRVEHKLTFGAGEVYQYDGSADVTVPVYTGSYHEHIVIGNSDVGNQEDNFED